MPEAPSRGDLEVGVISDTHGLLRPEALAALTGVDLILHAGDIGGAEILDRLGEIAPVHAVRGNTDHAPGVRGLPTREVLEVGRVHIVMIHILEDLDLDPEAIGADVVVFGHTHLPVIDRRGATLFLNPGSAGPPRPNRPVSLARLSISDAEVVPRLIPI